VKVRLFVCAGAWLRSRLHGYDVAFAAPVERRRPHSITSFPPPTRRSSRRFGKCYAPWAHEGAIHTIERGLIMNALFQRVSLFAGLMVVLSGAAFAAQPPSSGLGQSWPNAPDVSRSPDFHAYVFTRDGIKYIQVNDANGNVLGAVGTANGQFITLPIGRFAPQVTTPQDPASSSTTAAADGSTTPVYQDDTTTVTATPMSDGTVRLSAAVATGTCDPIECAGKNSQ
jgi:hypothetical protein